MKRARWESSKISLTQRLLLVWLLACAWGVLRPTTYQLDRVMLAPSFGHLFGCDAFGRDLGVLILHSAGVSQFFALLVSVLALTVGTVLAGALLSLGSWWRELLLRGLDLLLAVPALVLALGWAAVRGPGWDTLFVALGLEILPPMLRLLTLRGQEILAEEYVLASRSLGAGVWALWRNHLLRGWWGVLVAQFPFIFARALMAEAALSFVGVGVPVGRESWGVLLSQGRDYLFEAPWISAVAGVPLVLVIYFLQRESQRLAKSSNPGL